MGRISKSNREWAWEQASKIRGENPNLWRRDEMGNPIYKPSYGMGGEVGWEIDHVILLVGAARIISAIFGHCILKQTNVIEDAEPAGCQLRQRLRLSILSGWRAQSPRRMAIRARLS